MKNVVRVSLSLLVLLLAPLCATAGMNLRVDSISITGSPANAGGSVQFTATVTNIGDQLTAALVEVYLSSDPEFTTADDQLLWFAQSPILSPGQSATVTQSVSLPAALATGEYFLGTITRGWYEDVDPSDNVAGGALAVIGATCSPDAFEQDDTRAGARPVEVNDLQLRNHCDDPDDWVSFQAIAGTRYGIQSARVGYNSSWLTLAVYAADGTLVAETPANQPSDYPKLIWTAPDTGTYFVRVRPLSQWNRVGLATEYNFVIADTLADLVVPESDTYPKQGTAGGTDWFYTNVANYGFVDSGPFEVGVHISSSTNVTREDRRIGFRRIENLAPDRNMNISNVQIAFPSDLPAGTYYLAAIADDANRVAEYEEDNNTSQVTEVRISGPSCSPDAYEDDDLAWMARPIAINEQQAHNFCEDGFDWFSFDAAGGRTYHLRAIYPPPHPGGATSPAGTIEVHDLNGQVLAQGNGVLAWTASQSGTYRAMVRGGSSVNDYLFGVLDQLPDLAATVQWAMDTFAVPRGGVIDDGTWAVRNHGFADSPANVLGLYFSADTAITPTDQLLRTVPLPVIPPDGLESQTFVRVPVPQTQALGTYQFGAVADIGNSVLEFDEANNGTAIRQIDVVDPACAPDSYDEDDLPGQAKALAIGETQSRNFCEDGYDWVTADLQGGTTYAFEARGDTGSGVGVAIYDTEGRSVLVGGETGFNNAAYAWAAITAPATGRYYVLAHTLDQYGQRTRYGINMNYTLRAAICQPDAFEQDDADRTAGRPIAVGASQSRNHCEDGVDWAVLSIATPGAYRVATSALGAAADTILEIHSAGSTAPLAQNDNTSVNSKASSVTYDFAAGTYYIRIAGKQRGAGTEYTLSVQPAKGKK